MYGKLHISKRGRRCLDLTDSKLPLRQEREESELGPNFFLPVTREARSSRAVVATSVNLAFQHSDIGNVILDIFV